MRRSLALAMVVWLLASLPPSVAAAETRNDNPHGWTGTTEQGLDIRMFITRSDPRTIPSLSVTLHWTCEHGREGDTSFGFFGFDFPIMDGQVAFSFHDFHFVGNFSSNHGRGVANWATQKCSSGTVEWEAEPRIR